MQTLPKTIYLWLVLLIASLLLGNRLEPRITRPSPTVKPTKIGLSGPNFERYLTAERLTRTHYALAKFGGSDTLPEALAIYRELALATNQLNPARKVLILGNQLHKPLDETILKLLPEGEQSLWRSLYGPYPPPPIPLDAEAQLMAMQLRFLDNQALADLYKRLDNSQAAEAAEARRDAEAQGAILKRLVPLFVLAVLGGVIGLGLLLFVGFVALRREWHLLGRVSEAVEQKLTWGDLLDGFVFYLASYRALGLLVGIVVTSRAAVVPLQVLLQFATGGLALAYLAAKAKKRGTSLVELGVSRESLGANVLYGLGGYLATLPLLGVLGLLSSWLFRNSTTTAPNPAMTLLSGTSSTGWERGLLFVTISVGAPLFEEFFFRGALFTGLRRRFSGLPSILLSAVVFASVHPIQDALPIVGLGVSFATMRHLRQSLVPGMVAHFLQNTLTFLMLTASLGD